MIQEKKMDAYLRSSIASTATVPTMPAPRAIHTRPLPAYTPAFPTTARTHRPYERTILGIILLLILLVGLMLTAMHETATPPYLSQVMSSSGAAPAMSAPAAPGAVVVQPAAQPAGIPLTSQP